MSIIKGRNSDVDFRRDMSKYIDRASRSQDRFIALKEAKGKVTTEKKNEILVKEKTSIGYFFSKIGALFSSGKKEEIEEGVDVTDKIKENEDQIVETYSDEESGIERVTEEAPVKKSSSWFSRLFSVEREEESEEQTEEQSQPTPTEDMKQLAVLANDFLHRLSPDEIMTLRREGKIEEYKSLLRKNNLIK